MSAVTALEAPTPVTQPRWSLRRIQWLGMTPFVAVHLMAAGALWSGVTWGAVVFGLVAFWLRMFAVTAGYHRYFSHRAFRTSRVVQFLFALVAQTSAQKGVLWWAAHHRNHHRHSDKPEDIHSPRQDGFWYAHVLWIYDHTDATDLGQVKDLARYPELRFLNRLWWLPPWLLGFASYFVAGWPGLFVGFALSTVLLWHCTFTINSLTHVIGKRRFATDDDSKNHWLLALITMGEGWHNNHHHYMHAARQGFAWWEVDVTYYILRAMSWVGLVWDLREPPERVLARCR